jgi:hypothetical protein
MRTQPDYSWIKSAAATEELIRRHGVCLLVGLDDYIYCIRPEKIPNGLHEYIGKYAIEIIQLLRLRAYQS